MFELDHKSLLPKMIGGITEDLIRKDTFFLVKPKMELHPIYIDNFNTNTQNKEYMIK